MLQPAGTAAFVTMLVIALTQGVSYAVWGNDPGGYPISIIVVGILIPAVTCFPITLYLLLQRQKLHETIETLNAVQAELQASARLDAMTGLLHRQAFQGALAAPGATASGGRGTLMMIDVDHFKTVNDTFGHGAGDEAIGLIADALRHATREGDVSARYGGEEFCLYIPGITGEAALRRAEAIREHVESLRFVPAGVPHRLTVSIGVASRSGDIPTAALIEAADAALYSAKRQGRNRVVVAETPFPDPDKLAA